MKGILRVSLDTVRNIAVVVAIVQFDYDNTYTAVSRILHQYYIRLAISGRWMPLQ
jgi:hypothetical protein